MIAVSRVRMIENWGNLKKKIDELFEVGGGV